MHTCYDSESRLHRDAVVKMHNICDPESRQQPPAAASSRRLDSLKKTTALKQPSHYYYIADFDHLEAECKK